MEFNIYIRFVLVLVFVLGLVLLLGWVLRRSGIGGGAMIGKGRRLGVIETAFLGPKHRLVLVRRDQVEHLVLIGPTSSALVESGIAAGNAVSRSDAATGDKAFRALIRDELEAPGTPE